MAETIASLKEDFSLIDEWEDRYRYLIELGRTLEPLPEDAHVIDNHSGHVSLTNVTFYDNGSPGYSGLPGYPPSRVAVLNHDDTAVATMHMANVLLMGECGTTGHVTSDGGNIESGGHTCGFSALGDQADVPAAAARAARLSGVLSHGIHVCSSLSIHRSLRGRALSRPAARRGQAATRCTVVGRRTGLRP